MGFFNGWPIWQKLVFILGCAIVITVIMGCSKLIYTHWKSTTTSEKERIEEVAQRQMSQRRRAGSVPFGIRAIESGIEVEGVWISRPNSPDGARDTSLVSSKWDYGPGKDFIVEIESQNSSPTTDYAGSRSTLARPASAKRPSNDRSSQDSSPNTTMSKAARSKHPPLAYSKYTGNPSLQQGSVTGTLDGLEAIYRASGPMKSVGPFDSSMAEERLGSSGSSNKSITDCEPISASAPRLLNTQRTRQQSADLELRRMSQAAECGQLTPRIRRGDGCSTYETGDSPIYQSPPPSRKESPSPAWSYQISKIPPAVPKSSLPDVTPFTQFCLTAPADPQSRPCSPVGSMRSMRSNSSSSRPGTRQQTSRSPLHTTSPSTKPTPRSSFERHDPSILRGHGTGFEILQPGTFPDRKLNPPISLHNNSSRTRSNSTDQTHNKLQKKRRPSVESNTSSLDNGSSIA